MSKRRILTPNSQICNIIIHLGDAAEIVAVDLPDFVMITEDYVLAALM